MHVFRRFFTVPDSTDSGFGNLDRWIGQGVSAQMEHGSSARLSMLPTVTHLQHPMGTRFDGLGLVASALDFVALMPTPI